MASAQVNPRPTDRPVGFDTVWSDELETIRKSRTKRGKAVPTEARSIPAAEADTLGLIGVAFSGGGIRSATFNLGMLQAMARRRLLSSVDYLSTVSGGGYIGSWLHAMLHHLSNGASASILEVEKELDPERALGDSTPQRALAHLRSYSNYLTPKVSILSADTWALWAIWSRNTLLNLSVLAAGFSSMVLAALLLSMGMKVSVPGSACCGCLGAAALILAVAAMLLGANLARLTADAGGRQDSDGKVQRWILAPALGGSVLLTFAMKSSDLPWWGWRWLAFTALYWLFQWRGGFLSEFHRRNIESRPLKEGSIWILSAGGAGLVTEALLWVVSNALATYRDSGGSAWCYLTFGPPAVLTVLTLGMIVNVGLLGRDLPDYVREWLGRLGAWATVYVVGWLLVFGAAFYGPAILLWASGWAKVQITATWIATSVGGLLAGKSAKTDGASAQKTAGASWLNMVALVGPYAFMAGFVLAISLGVHSLATHRNEEPAPAPASTAAAAVTKSGEPCCKATVTVEAPCCRKAANPSGSIWDRNNAELAFMALGGRPWEWFEDGNWHHDLMPLFVFMVLITATMSWRIDVNEFSLHHFYKNRLVRCYLGASRNPDERQPNPFTGFDPEDDLPLSDLKPAEYGGPFPLLNATLNLSSGRKLAWQERKGAAFIFTPQHCGFDGGARTSGSTSAASQAGPQWRHRSGTSEARLQRAGIDKPRAAYLATQDVARSEDGGIRLGTALAISGAAASPNQGFHSSTAVAFLMTVLNVRMGWWLGNPSTKERTRSGPVFGLPFTLKELFGTTDADSGFVNLSDGGHFDNMGLYELVRRRVKYIILCDAEQDEDLAFGGLAEAIRLCRTDFGVEIDIQLQDLARKPDNQQKKFSNAHVAIGTILYPRSPEGDMENQHGDATGTLIYVKSSLTGKEPADVLGYHTRVSQFPHESTAEQWFTESQFESYRRLGLYIGDQLFQSGGSPLAEAGPFLESLKPY